MQTVLNYANAWSTSFQCLIDELATILQENDLDYSIDYEFNRENKTLKVIIDGYVSMDIINNDFPEGPELLKSVGYIKQ